MCHESWKTNGTKKRRYWLDVRFYGQGLACSCESLDSREQQKPQHQWMPHVMLAAPSAPFTNAKEAAPLPLQLLPLVHAQALVPPCLGRPGRQSPPQFQRVHLQEQSQAGPLQANH